MKQLGIKFNRLQKIYLDPTTLLSQKPITFENMKDD
jgi:hypothetical protein